MQVIDTTSTNADRTGFAGNAPQVDSDRTGFAGNAPQVDSVDASCMKGSRPKTTELMVKFATDPKVETREYEVDPSTKWTPTSFATKEATKKHPNRFGSAEEFIAFTRESQHLRLLLAQRDARELAIYNGYAVPTGWSVYWDFHSATASIFSPYKDLVPHDGTLHIDEPAAELSMDTISAAIFLNDSWESFEHLGDPPSTRKRAKWMKRLEDDKVQTQIGEI